MASYFYFGASLPLLLYHEPPRVTLAGYLEAASRLLAGDDFKAVKEARLDNFETGKRVNPLFGRFREWEIALRNRLAALRAAARKEDGAAYLRRSRPVVEAERAARAAFEAADPLAAEEVLNRARWEILSSLGNRHRFNLEFFIVYALKLQLLERKALMTRAIGENRHAALEGDLDKELAEKMQA